MREFEARYLACHHIYNRAGIEGQCYSGRRTLATRMVDKGINIAVVSKVLGHYGHNDEQGVVCLSQSALRDYIVEHRDH